MPVLDKTYRCIIFEEMPVVYCRMCWPLLIDLFLRNWRWIKKNKKEINTWFLKEMITSSCWSKGFWGFSFLSSPQKKADTRSCFEANQCLLFSRSTTSVSKEGKYSRMVDTALFDRLQFKIPHHVLFSILGRPVRNGIFWSRVKKG